MHFYLDRPLGDFTIFPPEVLERIMGYMRPENLVPLMMSCSIIHALAQNERVWNKVYRRTMPDTHKALHLAPNPDFWRFRNDSSVKFVYEYSKLLSAIEVEEVDAVMHVMKTHSNSVLVQRAAVYILRRLAYYPQVCDKKYREKIETFRAKLGSNGAITSCVDILNRFQDTELLAGALCAIGNLVIDGNNAEMLLETQGIDKIVNVLDRHSDSYTVLDFGCFALCNMGDEYARVVKYKEAIYKARAPEVALKALQRRCNRPEELTPAVDLLAALCHVQDCKKQHGRTIIDAIDFLFPIAVTNTKLLAHTLTLTVLVCENLDENRDYALTKSFIEKVFQILAAFEHESSIVVKASLVLFTLFWRNERPEMNAHRSQLIRLIVNAMKSFKQDTPLQRTSAAMLSDFSHSSSELRGLIISLGGKELVRAALYIPPGEQTDPEWAALAASISIDD
jgi:hypothetical protein